MSVNSKMTAIADAIRAKTGGTDALTLDGMAEAVAGIETGGGDDFAKSIVERTITEVNDGTIETIGAYSFKNCSSLTSVNMTAAKTMYVYAFDECKYLTTVSMPSLTTGGAYGFNNCIRLETVNMASLSGVADNMFSSCKIKSIDLPSAKTVGQYGFKICEKLETVVIPSATTINKYAFSNCKSLKSVVLDGNSVCTLSASTAFYGCVHILGTVDSTYNPDGLMDGYIYVPDALVEDYKAATNWSTYASQIRPLSEYVEVTA